MADLGNRTNVNSAIDLLLDDLQPNEAIQPSDHNGLLKDILDTLANGLSVTLRTGNTTSGQNIEITSGDSIDFDNSTFIGSLISDTLTAARTYTLPDKTGTIAMLSDIVGGDSIYTASGTVPTSVVATLTDTLTFEGDNSTTDVLKLGKIFTGAATGGHIAFQVNTASSKFLNVYNSAAISTSDTAFAMGFDSAGFPSIGGDGLLKLSSSTDFGSTIDLKLEASAARAVFNASGLDFVMLDYNGDCWILPNNAQGLGIGTFSPTAKLHVKGDSTTQDVFSVETTAGADIITVEDGGELILSGSSLVGAEKNSLQGGETLIQGADTLSTSTALSIWDNDTIPSKLWDWRNNGDVYINQDSTVELGANTLTFNGDTNLIKKDTGTTYNVYALKAVTQVEYDALTPDSDTIYFIV